MRIIPLRVVLILCGAAFLANCGSPGIPVPPSLELPRPVTDLRAARKGDKVVLTWTRPLRTTTGQNIRRFGWTQVCGNLGNPLKECGTPVAKLKAQGNAAPGQISYTDHLPETLLLQNPAADLFYAVDVVNSYGRSAGLSNQASVPSAPTLPAPSNFTAQLTAQGVLLSWRRVPAPTPPDRVRYGVRIYRREAGQAVDAIAGETPLGSDSAPEFTDTGFAWEKTYAYRGTIVTRIAQADGSERQVEGEDTAPVTIIAHDVFPPATPTGLEAVFSGPEQKPFVDLIWSPNTESDLAGYNVYRREGGGEPVKANPELVKSPAWQDIRVEAGQRYFYAVTAVDARGNESARSQEAAESVPAQ
jgi:hypothetical protein